MGEIVAVTYFDIVDLKTSSLANVTFDLIKVKILLNFCLVCFQHTHLCPLHFVPFVFLQSFASLPV